MNNRNVLFITQSYWSEKKLHLTKIDEFNLFTLDISFVTFPEKDSGLDVTISNNDIDKALKIISTGRFQAVMGYDADIFLLFVHMKRNGFTPPPMISITLEPEFRAGRLLAAAGIPEGEFSLDEFVKNENTFWFCATREFMPMFMARGIPPQRLAYLPYCSFTRNLFNPLAEGYLKKRPSEMHPTALAVQGKILAAGTFNRDYVTFIRSCRGLSEDVFIITNVHELINTSGRKQFDVMTSELKGAPNVSLLEPVPLNIYIDCLRRARMVVVPLLRDNFSTGHLTISDAQRLARPVIASDLPTARDFIRHGHSGLLYQPGNPVSLREQIDALLSDSEFERKMAKRGRAAEKSLSSLTEKSFTDTLRTAFSNL